MSARPLTGRKGESVDYEVIDIASWPRREYFEHYMNAVPCTYSMTVRLDITNLRREGLRLYPAMLWLLTGAVNRCEQFRMALRPDGELVRYSRMEPSYTVFHRETHTFSNLWTEYSPDYAEFLSRYEEDLRLYGGVEAFAAKPDAPENCFTVSMLPWASFEGFNLNTADFRYLIPIFTLGKFCEDGGRALMPVAVQVHHAVCDGYHTCSFLEGLQNAVDSM